MRETKCALCGLKKSFLPLYRANFSLRRKIDQDTFSARRLPDQLHYRIVKCQKCGLVRSNPILSPQKIARLYKKSRVTYQAEIPDLKKTYGDYLKKTIPFLSQKNNLLEIGCGNGFFLEEALAQGFKNMAGVEPSEKAIKQAPKKLQKYIKNDFFHRQLFTENSFDLVCCFHTLDHVINPQQFIKDVYQVLRPQACALFIVHDVDSLMSKLFRENWPIFDIEHIYLFSKKTLAKIFEKNKFQAIKLFNVKNQYSLRYWLRTSPIPNRIKKYLINLFKKLNLAEARLILPAGNIAIIARKTAGNA